MRLRWSLLAVPLLAGCGSSWKGDPFPNPFASNPAWADCDGDGLGDPNQAPVCIDFDDPSSLNDESFCGNPVRNGLDCDDDYAESGAQLGTSCPADYDWMFEETPLNYRAIPLGGREFLVWDGAPVHYNLATSICDSWNTLGPPVPNESGGVATLNGDFQLGEVTSQITSFYGTWRGWVGLKFSAETNTWMWEDDPTEAGAAGIPFCDGVEFTPEDVVSPASLSPEFENELQDVVDEVYVLLELSDGERCLRNPRSPEHCPDSTLCLEADILCEREAIAAPQLAVFELGDLNCVVEQSE